LTTLPLKEFGKYCRLWQSVYSPLVTHTFINCQMCKIGSSLSWCLGNYIRNTFARATAMMGGMFIINTTIISGNFKEILVLTRSRLLKTNLNIFLQETLLVMLLLSTSFIASFFDHFLDICGHPFSMIELNILKTLIRASRVLGSF
jgi:hypothetical protein